MIKNFDYQMKLYKDACSKLSLSDDVKNKIKKMENNVTVIEEIRKYRLNIREHRTKWIAVVVSIAIILSASVGVYAALLSGGKLDFIKTNGESNKNTAVSFVLDDTIKISLEELDGQVKECSSIIKEQIEKHNMLSSVSPYVVKKEFDDINAAVGYIGYTAVNWPSIEKNEKISAIIQGDNDGNLVRINMKSEYYKNGYNYSTEASIFTEKYVYEVGVGLDSFSDAFGGVDYKGKTVCKNGREFYVVDSSEFEDGWFNKIIYWQENKVVYTFFIRYKEVDSNAINIIVDRWMNAF